MYKRLFGFLIVACLLLGGRAWAGPPCTASAPVYISSGSQILCVETASGANFGKVTVLVTDNSSVFGDVAFGPDGRLYFTDTLGNRVFRFDPASTASSADLVTNIPSGTSTGLSFSGSDGDLYINASTGVSKLARIASLFSPIVPLTPTPIPVQVITFAPTITAGGNAFDISGNLVIFDQSNSQVLQAASPYTSLTATPVTGISNSGPGIAVNFCGEFLAASGTTIQRFSGGVLNTFANFGSNNTVRYFEVTADNTVFATTFANGAGGIVWRIAPVVDSTGLPSCTATPTTTPVVSLKSALQAKTPSDLASNIANGVALPATSISIKRTFGASDGGTCTSATVDQSLNKRVYNFGHHTFSVTYKQLLACFSQTFTAFRSRPFLPDIVFANPPFVSNTVPVHYSSLSGLAVHYVTPDPGPQAGTDYVSTGSGDAIQLKVAFVTQDILADPGVAHAAGDAITVPVTYTTDFTHDFWPAFAPGVDPGVGGGTDGTGSKLLVFNQGLKAQDTITLKEPALSNNPKFNAGQTIRVSFKLTDPSGQAVNGASFRLSILRIDPTPLHAENVVSTNNTNVQNKFKNTSGGTYTFPVDSSFFEALPPGTTATYQFTIFGDSASPFTFSIQAVF